MNYTENYNLPQWEDTDAVKREDINGAMAAIDEALAELASPLVKLYDVTTSADQSSMTISFSGTDVTKYAALELYLSSPTPYELHMRLNGSSSYNVDGSSVNYFARFRNYNSGIAGYVKMLGHSAGSGAIYCQFLRQGNSAFEVNYGRAAIKWENLSTITIAPESANYTIPAGTHLVVCGLR